MSSNGKPTPSRLKNWLQLLRDNPIYTVVWLFVLIGGVILFGSAVILIWDVGHEAYGALWQKPPFRWERLAILLFIPAFICFLIATIIYASKERKQANWRFVGYQIVTFAILALSLRAFGLHHGVEIGFGEDETQPVATSPPSPGAENSTETVRTRDNPNKAEEAARNIAEMAAIMVLFVLAELAAFVAHDVTATKTGLIKLGERADAAASRTEEAAGAIGKNLGMLQDTTNKIRNLQFVSNIMMLHPSVLKAAVNLVSGWAKRVPASSPEDDEKKHAYRTSELCWRILLEQYLEEELHDFTPKSVGQGIPNSVKPLDPTTVEDVSVIEDVSFLATNVGFYAKLLTSLVKNLSSQKDTNHKLCMAIVTNMLPAHCWNWPMEEGEWRSYDPIDSYRNSMLEAATTGSQIDRVLLVYDDPEDVVQETDNEIIFRAHEHVFWRRKLLRQMWDEWYILLRDGAKNEKASSDPFFATIRGELGTAALPLFPLPIRCAAVVDDPGTIYPMIVSDGSKLNFKDKVLKEWVGRRLSDEYNELHGQHGICWELPLDNKSLNIFGGRHDIMFIGLGPGSEEDSGLWTRETVCDWALCLMSSINPTTETMFLTVISGKSVKVHFEWVQTQLHENLPWSTNRLNKKPVPVKH